jgi:GntR family transcriptional repressor for pyruvate dehydrogenase complex
MLIEMKAAPFMAEPQQDARITATLISHLKKQIASGAIAPGDKFPPERELAKTFKVNRASMRQALKVLESMGVLSQKVGDGTYLSNSADTLLREPLDFLVLLDDLSLQDLADTRLILAPELAGKAAERATGEHLAAMRTAIAAMEKSKTTRERIAADFDFHDAVFRASGNRIGYLLLSNLHRLLFYGPRQPAKAPVVERVLLFQRRIYAAIKARDGKEVREAMRQCILDTAIPQTQDTEKSTQ